MQVVVKLREVARIRPVHRNHLFIAGGTNRWKYENLFKFMGMKFGFFPPLDARHSSNAYCSNNRSDINFKLGKYGINSSVSTLKNSLFLAPMQKVHCTFFTTFSVVNQMEI